MPAPSKLAISTSSVQRLLKDEQSYRKEQAQQEIRIQKLETEKSNDENAGYILAQERKSLEETKAIFPSLKKRLADAAAKLSDELACAPLLSSPPLLRLPADILELQAEADAAGTAPAEEIAAAKAVLDSARSST